VVKVPGQQPSGSDSHAEPVMTRCAMRPASRNQPRSLAVDQGPPRREITIALLVRQAPIEILAHRDRAPP